MKVIYFHFLKNPEWNDSFQEMIKGLEIKGVKTSICPKIISYNEVKNYNIIIFDSPPIIKKHLGYYPIVDEKCNFIKKGLLTFDFWVDLCHKETKEWIEKYKANDFIILRHSSGIQLLNREYNKFENAVKVKIEESKKTKFNPSSKAYIDFKNIILSSFTIDRDRMILADNIKKEYDICLGAHICDLYPLRKRIVDVVNKSKKFKVIDPILKKDKVIREKFTNYYKGISKSWLSLATTGLANISTRKHYEICALNSTCLGNHTNLEDHEIVKQNTISLNLKMKDKEIIEIIEKTLSDKENLKKMSDETKYIIREQYDYRNVARKLIENLENIFK